MENYYYKMDFNLERFWEWKLPDQWDYQTESSMMDFEGQYEWYKYYENLSKNKTNLPNLIIDFNKNEYYESRWKGYY